MSQTVPPPGPPAADAGLDARELAFESVWLAHQSGPLPRWDQFLPEPGQRCSPDFVFWLIRTDILFRIEAGLPALLQEPYFAHPRLQADDARLGPDRQAALIQWEYQHRWQRGDRAARQAYLDRFPQLAARLQDLKPRWNCPACRQQAIPLEETALTAVCPRCGQTQDIASLFPLRAMQSPAALHSAIATQPDSPREHLLPPLAAWPTAIPGYEIQGVLGQGGMGVVYRARHRQLDRLVALKMIRTDAAPMPSQLSRFQTEARAAARLNHPNIVRIYDIGQHEGLPYLALEYIAGESLAQQIRGQAWQPAAAARLAATVARAVQHAHEQGILHRDLKPGNVLLDAQGQPHLTDFGLARRLQTDGPGATHKGDIIGSPAYMPPEQAEGQLDRVGPASDVFGLGTILYEMLTGQPPYAGKDPCQVLHRASQARIPPPRQLNPKVPRSLERICLKALAADPAQRYPSAAAFADELDRFRKRPRQLAWTAALVVLTLLASVAFLPGPRPSARTEYAAAKPLTGELTVLLQPPQEGTRRRRVEELGALPGLPGEWVHIEGRVSEPAYLYLLLLDSQGEVSPLYPWNLAKRELDLSDPPPAQKPRRVVVSPTDPNREAAEMGWPLDDHTGLETILLLARRTPLPATIKLVEVIGDRLPPTQMHDPREVVTRGFDTDQPVGQLNVGHNRGLGKEAERRDDPLLQLMARLRDQAGFEMIRAVRFAHQGKE